MPATILATLVPASIVTAQYRLPTITAVAQADSIHRAAEMLAENSHRWRDAASLHRQSAALRAPEDSLGYRCLNTAANLSFASNDLASAQSDKIAAAAQALARGDVENAAQAYADAAWIANERKHHDPEQVLTLARQAEVLASSPLLSSMQRTKILERFVHPERDMAVQSTR
ncbi:MAG TPA: hypothetical protein VJQ46_15145, partial [Gemmatimonadales bacterium]|nr:hypothetical protein [Gemmatimonadales bacterium]